MADHTGQQLGNYRLIRVLGQGGFADVYLGEHVFLKTLAAIKVLRLKLTTDEALLFLTEARTIAGLVHPNIVRVLEFGVEGSVADGGSSVSFLMRGTPFLAMDYAPNGTLREHLPKGVSLPITSLLPFIKQVATALQYAHDQKLIHRDVKPENMLLGQRNEVLLTDFGVAIFIQNTQSANIHEMAGTMAYSAPEQLRGKPRLASDQYALGVVVYEWLSGNRPFQGSFSQITYQHLFASPPPLRNKIPGISAEIEAVVFKALAKDPRQRFGSVQEFASALEQASYQWRSAILAPSLSHPPIQGDAHMPSAQPHQLAPSIPPQVQPVSRGITHPSRALKPPSRFSRRTLVGGIVSLSGLVAIGGIIWLALRPFLGKSLFIYRGHSSRVSSVAWSPDSRHITSGSNDHTVQVWDAVSGNHAFTYRGHSSYVNAVAWSTDGQHIASGSDDHTVQVWDAVSGNHAFTYRGHSSYVFRVTWSSDSKLIASGSDDQTVQVWDVASGNQIFAYHGHLGSVNTVAWAPDGQHIASGSDDHTVQVWDATSGNHAFTYYGHLGRVIDLAWSPNSKRLASGSDDHTVQVWDATSGNHAFTYYGHSNYVSAVAWSPDGQRIASGSHDGTVRVWDATSGDDAYVYRGHTSRVSTVAWSPDGQYIASGSHDNTVQVWDAV